MQEGGKRKEGNAVCSALRSPLSALRSPLSLPIPSRVYLTGPMASGKSTVGPLLAGLLGAVCLLALGRVQFFLQDFLAAYLGDHVGFVAHAGVALDTQQRKRWNDEEQQQELHQALVGTDEIEHGLPIADK